MFDKGLAHLIIYLLPIYFFGPVYGILSIICCIYLIDKILHHYGYERIGGNDIGLIIKSEELPTNISGYFLMQKVNFETFRDAFVKRLISKVKRTRQVPTVKYGVFLWKLVSPEMAIQKIINESKIIKDEDGLREYREELATQFMDPTEPLFEFRFIQNYSQDSSAVIYRVNHAICDGVGFSSLMSCLNDNQFSSKSYGKVFKPSLFEKVKLFFKTPYTFIKAEIENDGYQTDLQTAKISDINKNVDDVFTFFDPTEEFCMDKVRKSYKQTPGMTLNDYILANVVRGITQTMKSHGIEDTVHIKTQIPVSLRKLPTSYDDLKIQNSVHGRTILLPMTENITECMKSFKPTLKRLLNLEDIYQLYSVDSILRYVPPFLAKFLVNTFGNGLHLVVSNIPFSDEPYYIGGKKVTKFRLFNNPVWSAKVAFFAYTYNRKLILSMVSKRNVKIDTQMIHQRVIESFKTEIQKA